MGRFDIITEDYFVEKVVVEDKVEFDVESFAWTMMEQYPGRFREEEEETIQETPETKSLWTRMRAGVSKRRW